MDFNISDSFLSDFPLTVFVAAFALLLSWIMQLWFLLKRVFPLAVYKNPEINHNIEEPLSVIICAKNESNNLKKFLPEILTQEYPNYEVIVVNDCSEDNTETILAELKEKYPKLYYTTIPVDKKFKHGKKLAISIGIKAAKNENLVFTDADCRSVSKKWLKHMATALTKDNIEIVTGFGGYEKRRGFFNQLVRYDAFFAAIQYMGFTASKKPYMGTGRNLAYKKGLYIKTKGFRNHSHILSGDDDLFVHQAANKENTTILINKESQTISKAPDSFKEWIDQKSRHLSTTPLYKKNIKRELALEPLSRIIFWTSAVFLMFFNIFVLLASFFIVTKIIMQLIMWRKIAKKMEQEKLYLSVTWFEFIHPFLLLIPYFGYLLGKEKNSWK
ncbi:glycosyltransferase [Marinilabiliaceae bacterium ANBcel2]|nr:glycosyltransferase [Marinilabiliaceae bacterium ANBcel2]